MPPSLPKPSVKKAAVSLSHTARRKAWHSNRLDASFTYKNLDVVKTMQASEEPSMSGPIRARVGMQGAMDSALLAIVSGLKSHRNKVSTLDSGKMCRSSPWCLSA